MCTTSAMRKCSDCGIEKPLTPAMWLVSRGVPAGNFCKLCVAKKRRAERQVAKLSGTKSGIRLELMSVRQLVDLAEIIQFTYAVSIDAVLNDEIRFLNVRESLRKYGFTKTVLLAIK